MVGEAIVFALLMRRGVWRILPVFCVYVGWTLTSDPAAYFAFRSFSAHGYRNFYLIESTIDSLVQFAVLVELMWSVLRPIRASLPRSTPVVLGVLILLVGLVIWPLAGMTVPPKFTDEAALLFHVQETFAILRVVCFLLMASFSQLLSIGWRDRELQIATGLGFYSIVSLIVALLHSHQGTGPEYHWPDQALSVSYIGSLSYWVLSFATKEQERKEFSPQMQQLLLLMSGGARAGRVALGDLSSERPKKRI